MARDEQDVKKRNRRRRGFALALGATAVEATVVARRRGSLFAVNTIVRCRDGHLFTTLWLPGGSVKAIRLGWWRFQKCPVGRHWTFVTPVDVSTLSEEDRAEAERHPDVRVP